MARYSKVSSSSTVDDIVDLASGPAMTRPSHSILSDSPTPGTLSNAQGQGIHPNALEILATVALWESGGDSPTVEYYSPSPQPQCDHHDKDHRDETAEAHGESSQAPFSTEFYGTAE